METQMETLPQLLVANAHKYGHRKIAMREKALGIWQPYTWADYLEQVKSCALGLAALQMQRGEKLAVIGDNRPPLYWMLLAAEALGGIPVPAVSGCHRSRDRIRAGALGSQDRGRPRPGTGR
jgi:long-chain acyl-CoA synthetase